MHLKAKPCPNTRVPTEIKAAVPLELPVEGVVTSEKSGVVVSLSMAGSLSSWTRRRLCGCGVSKEVVGGSSSSRVSSSSALRREGIAMVECNGQGATNDKQ